MKFQCNQKYQDGTKLYGYDDLHLNETVPEDWTKALTPYGYVEPNYYEAGDKFDIYDRRKDAPCNDFKEGCEYELTVIILSLFITTVVYIQHIQLMQWSH
jgi:hypothetical protein